MVTEVLKIGAENAITSRDLCDVLNLDPRTLAAIINKERQDGSPICASTGSKPGYFLAKNRAEMCSFCRSLQHRAEEILRTRKACARTLGKLKGGRSDAV